MGNLDINDIIYNDDDFDFKEIDAEIIDTFIKEPSINDSLIRLYNLFISCNPNYLYNKTYILDSLDNFKENVLMLKQKYEASFKLIKRLLKLEIDGDWFIIIDDYYIVTSKTNNELMSYAQFKNKIHNSTEDTEPSSLYLNKIKSKSYKYINCNIYNVDRNNCSIRFFYNNQVRLFSYKLENYNNNKKKLLNQIQDFIGNCYKKVEMEDAKSERKSK